MFFFQCIFGIFMTESALFCLWFPLEKCILSSIPKYMKFIYMKAARNGPVRLTIECLCNNSFLMSISYALSLLILACVMHSTRTVDFRLLRSYGLRCFLDDASFRFKRGITRLVNSLKIWKKNCRPGRKPRHKCS